MLQLRDYIRLIVVQMIAFNFGYRIMEDKQALEEMLRSEEGGEDWRQEDNEKTLFKQPRIKDLFPTNYIEERDRFFEQQCNYNPHFVYKTIVSPEVLPALALKILTNNKYERHKLPILTEQEVRRMTGEYLEGLGLSDYVEVKMEFNTLSRTTVGFFKERAVLKLRTPLEYTKVSLEGVLNHEVGTHILRRLNHKQNCVRKPSEKGKLIEQGLAVINQMLPEEQPFLFKAALRYVAAIYASKMTFAEVYKMLKKHMRDANDCWRETVRVKRGMGSTEERGGYYKDQSYLKGAIEILRHRKDIDFRKIYYGKLSPQQTKNLNSGVLPPFIDSEQKYKLYLKKLNTIALCNFID